MGTIVSQVIDTLTAAGIRADEAYPGGRIPALTGPVAAVRLGRVDRSVRTTTVQVIVMSPASAGGSQCETTALEAVEVLQGMGATCLKEICKFDEMADVFYIDLTAEFFGTALADDWKAGPGYAVSINIQPLPHVVSFQAKRAVDETVTDLEDAAWLLAVEELLPPGTSEPVAVTESFQITVSRDAGDEIFEECTWESISREDTIRGIRQYRTARSSVRSSAEIL